MVVEARQSFQIVRQITWFLVYNRALCKSRYRILHYFNSIYQIIKNQSVQANFILTTRATLPLNTKQLY